MGILSSLGRLSSFGGSCFRACAARVTVVVCVCVCVSVLTNITHGASVRPGCHLVGDEGQGESRDFPETTAFKSYAAKHERNSQ